MASRKKNILKPLESGAQQLRSLVHATSKNYAANGRPDMAAAEALSAATKPKPKPRSKKRSR